MAQLNPVQFEFGTMVDWDDWQLTCIPNIKYAASLKVPHLKELLTHGGRCVIVGAGPSVKNYVEQIKAFKEEHEFNTVMTLNGAHTWLIQQGVKPNIHVIFEPDLVDVHDALGGPPVEGIAYYVASQSARSVFDQLRNHHRVLWHAAQAPEGYQKAINEYFPGEFMVAGGYATFFRSLSIAVILGYRDFDLFGVDSSCDDSSHIDGYVSADKEQKFDVWGVDPRSNRLKKFVTQGGLAFQAHEFLSICKNHPGLRVRAHGDGLLRYLHESRYPEQYEKGT